MPRPRRKPGPPGRAHVVCSHRDDDAEPASIKVLQMTAHKESPGGIMFTALGGVPAEGNAYSFRCPPCGRHLKIRKDRFPQVVRLLAEQQETHGESPVLVDISRIERGLSCRLGLSGSGYAAPWVGCPAPCEGVVDHHAHRRPR